MAELLTETGATAAPAIAPPRAWWWPAPWLLVVATAAVASARLGLRPISDNSTLVHLKTGIRLLDTGHVPHHDPYSYTAPGHIWVVQSWFASLLYGVANSIGHHALVIEQALLYAALGAVIMLSARSITIVRSAIAGLIAICAAAPGWSPRPLMFGLLCLALLVLITTRRANPLLLVPVVWLWVDTHGSFPLGVAWLVATAVGEAIDVRGWPRQALRYCAGFAAGLAVALANPVGWRLLAFPLVAVQKRSTFANIVEWRSPNFQDANTLLALAFIVVAFAVLFRSSVGWVHVLPVCVFLAAGLIAERNLGPLGVVLGAPLAAALAMPRLTHPWARWFAHEAHRVGWWGWLRGLAGVAVAAAAGLLLVLGVHGPTLDLSSYPVSAVDYLQQTGRLGPAHRIAAVDVVGCYLVWRAGPDTKVFIDDRYDMYPRGVAADAGILSNARSDAVSVLNEWHVDTVVWASAQALPGELLSLGGWQEVWSDQQWSVLERRPTVTS